jgi:hypothetical protein
MKIVSAPKVGPPSGEVRFGSIATELLRPRDVRYAPEATEEGTSRDVSNVP